ncbi:integrase, partial [Salmonella enterica subsp. enterica]|nr:integrase [Salmonella enterica subsp. enterica]
MKTTDFAKYLSDFMTIYLINERGFSNNTIKAYRDAFVQLISYMETYKKLSINKLTLADITKENVVAFLDWIEIERHCSVSTRNGRLA